MSKVYQFPDRPVVPPAHLRARLHEGCPLCTPEAGALAARRAALRAAALVALTAAALLVAWVIA